MDSPCGNGFWIFKERTVKRRYGVLGIDYVVIDRDDGCVRIFLHGIEIFFMRLDVVANVSYDEPFLLKFQYF